MRTRDGDSIRGIAIQRRSSQHPTTRAKTTRPDKKANENESGGRTRGADAGTEDAGTQDLLTKEKLFRQTFRGAQLPKVFGRHETSWANLRQGPGDKWQTYPLCFRLLSNFALSAVPSLSDDYGPYAKAGFDWLLLGRIFSAGARRIDLGGLEMANKQTRSG